MRRAVFNMRDDRPIWTPPAAFAKQLRAVLPDDWELVEVKDSVTGRGDGGGVSTEALDAIRTAEIYFGLGLPRDLLRVALEPPSRLRWVHTGTAGVRSLLYPELRTHQIVLTNSAGVHGAAMAETVLAMILYFARGLDIAVYAQHQREWRADVFERVASGVHEISGATLGVIGYGGIGRQVAHRAAALGMRVLATRRRPAADDIAEILTGDDARDRLLAASDFVVLAVPSTPATRGLVGARELALLRPDAVLINVGRGDAVDEPALIAALQAGRLRGAALDVFATEPLPQDSPLWSLRNVLITPHVSATTNRFWEREGELILDNVRRYLAGTTLRNVVDPDAGY